MLFGKDLIFNLASQHLNYTEYLVSFELFYRNLGNLVILANEDTDFVKTRTIEAAILHDKAIKTISRNIFRFFLIYKIYLKIRVLLS